MFAVFPPVHFASDPATRGSTDNIHSATTGTAVLTGTACPPVVVFEVSSRPSPSSTVSGFTGSVLPVQASALSVDPWSARSGSDECTALSFSSTLVLQREPTTRGVDRGTTALHANHAMDNSGVRVSVSVCRAADDSTATTDTCCVDNDDVTNPRANFQYVS